MSTAQVEVDAARFLGPRTGQGKSAAFTTASSDFDLSADATLKHMNGRFVCMVATQDVQFAFGDAAVTVGSGDPYLPAGTPLSLIATGTHVGLKGLSASGQFYIWLAS